MEIESVRTDATLRAETEIVAALLRRPVETLAAAGTLSPYCFSLASSRAIYNAALELRNEGKSDAEINPTIVMERAEQDGVLLSDEVIDQLAAADPITPAVIPHHAEMLRNAEMVDSRRRIILDGIEEFGSPGQDPCVVSNKIIQELEFMNSMKRDAQGGSVAAFDSFLESIASEKYKPFPTGMPAFDAMLNGGFYRQALIMLTGAPGAGKTTFAQQLFEGIAKNGNPVLYLNLEMSRDQLLARSLSRIIWRNNRVVIDPLKIMRSYSLNERQKNFLRAAAEEYRKTIAPNMEYLTNEIGTDLDRIMAELDTAAARSRMYGKPAPVIVLDYLHLITSESKLDEQEILKKAVAALKDYAIRNDTIVFTIAANSREANKANLINLNSARGSSSIEYTADIQIALNYKALHDGEDENGNKVSATNPKDMARLKKQSGKMVVQILKNRMTGTDNETMIMQFERETSTFTPIDQVHDDPFADD